MLCFDLFLMKGIDLKVMDVKFRYFKVSLNYSEVKFGVRQIYCPF